MSKSVFIIDCPWCKAKVAAEREGFSEKTGWIDEIDEPFGHRLYIGPCPKCNALLAGESIQRSFSGYDSNEDEWSDIIRVYPNPPKRFSSYNIPKVVIDSISEADKSLQADANTAACVMLGRALEAVCRDKLADPEVEDQKTKKIMLGEGIRKLKDKGLIDERLFSWSQDLQAFRNIAAHPDDTVISREDAEDLRIFVYAIIENVYDLAERYQEFKDRLKNRKKRKVKRVRKRR